MKDEIYYMIWSDSEDDSRDVYKISCHDDRVREELIYNNDDGYVEPRIKHDYSTALWVASFSLYLDSHIFTILTPEEMFLEML